MEVREKGTASVAAGSSAVGDAARGNFSLVKLAGIGAFLVNKKSNRCNSVQTFIRCITTLHVWGVTAPIISFEVSKYLHTVPSVGFIIPIEL